MRTVVLPALVSMLATVAAARADDPPAELQGRWELVSVESQGQPFALKEGRPRWEVAGDRVRYAGEDLARLTADPAANPRSLDLVLVGPGRTLEGVYALDRDTLKVCLNRRSDGVKERPNALSTRGHDDWRLLTFRRVGDGEGDGELSGFLGLALDFDEERKRVVVDATLEGSPAAKAGLKKGDVVEAIGGEGVAGLREAVAAARRAKPRSQLAVRISRDGELKEVMVRVGVLPFTAIADLD